jgi:hypothetical protein
MRINESTTLAELNPRGMASEALAAYVADKGQILFLELIQLKPFIEELWVRFENLKPGETIYGCSTQKSFCETVLHKDPRTVRYMLNGGNPASKRKRKALPSTSAETVSAASLTLREPAVELTVADSISSLPLHESTPAPAVTKETLTETFYVIRRKSDGKFLNRTDYRNSLFYIVDIINEAKRFDEIETDLNVITFKEGTYTTNDNGTFSFNHDDDERKRLTRSEWDWTAVKVTYQLTAVTPTRVTVEPKAEPTSAISEFKPAEYTSSRFI